MFQSVVRRDAFENLDLLPDEQIVYVVQRHPVMLAARALPPLLLVLLMGGLAWYRSVGGQFFVGNVVEDWRFGIIDLVLILLAVGGIISWLLTWGERGALSSRWGLLGLELLVIGLLIFRATGGRIFSIDPLQARPFDIFNGILLTIALSGVVSIVYTFLDWANDQLILTNLRVIVDNDQFLVRRWQEQLPVAEIQNIVALTKTYFQHWLNFGDISITSAYAGRRLTFTAASKPLEAQDQMMKEVRQLRQQWRESDLARKFEAQVIKGDRRKDQLPPLQQIRSTDILGRLLGENPSFDAQTRTYTWRPHWIFLVKALIKPTAFLLVLLVLIISAGQSNLFAGTAFTLLLLIGLTIFLGWAAWEIEDYRNERYVLSPTNVIDVTKKPLGPEARRTAKLDALQNVFYRTTLISQILGYGDVVVETAGSGGGFTFTAVPRPREVVTRITDYQTAYRRQEQERNIEATLFLLRQFHESMQRGQRVV